MSPDGVSRSRMTTVGSARWRTARLWQVCSDWNDRTYGSADVSASSMLSPTRDAEALTVSRARCAYRAVVWTRVCPRSFPIIGRLSPSCTAREAKLCRRLRECAARVGRVWDRETRPTSGRIRQEYVERAGSGTWILKNDRCLNAFGFLNQKDNASKTIG